VISVRNDADFGRRYDAVLEKWPVPRESFDVRGRFGSTHVNICGPADASPLVLIPGGRSTSAGWHANVGSLAAARRVYAVDLLGDLGYSVPAGARMKSRSDIVAWLDGVLDAIGLDATALAGHSYGAWIAACYAIARPGKVSRLVLVEPTDTLAATKLGFRLHAVPLFLGRGQRRFVRFFRWETGAQRCDPEFADLWAGTARNGAGARIVWPRRPGPAELARLTMPVLVVAASRSRQNDCAALEAGSRLLPDARYVLIDEATHFSVLTYTAERLNPVLVDFLT
jgi:pimeloyl-ACP methyl ester carboxylesterase